MSRPERPPFPVDKEGDVLITVTPERVYKLSSERLRTSGSDFFASRLEERYATELCAPARGQGVKTRWHFVVGFVEGETNRPAFYMLALNDWAMPVAADVDGSMTAIDASGTKTFRVRQFDPRRGLGVRSEPLVEAWDIVLSLITGDPTRLPELSGKWPKEEYGVFLATAVNMVDIAKTLGCFDKVVRRIQADLLVNVTALSEQISHDPGFWLYLAGQMRNVWLYKESIIHAAALYNHPAVQNAIDEGRLSAFDASLVANKAQAIKLEAKRVISFILNGLGDKEAADARTLPGTAGRNMATGLRIFREYLQEQIAARGHGAPWEWPDLGFSACKSFSNKKYLNDEELGQWLEREGMVAEPWKTDVTTVVKNLKAAASAEVKHMMKNNAAMSIKEKHKMHFTCIVIDDADVPFKPFQ